MNKSTFTCIDGHTCGNPVRVVVDGDIPHLIGATMNEKRLHFLSEFDWIRRALMFEPRGHDMMSGSIIYPPTRPDCDVAILFIETSGCLPMCGHGLIGTVTILLENKIVTPKTQGMIKLDTPAGRVDAYYQQTDEKVDWVKFKNVPAFLYKSNLSANIKGLGNITADVAFGGNFYAIIDSQPNFNDLAELGPEKIIRFSPLLRKEFNHNYKFLHPTIKSINKLTHILWTGKPTMAESDAKNAVFYGEKAIDRSPCGTGTSARMAQWYSKGHLQVKDEFVHESIIGSTFTGCVESVTSLGEYEAIIPTIKGWAKITGYNTIIVDDADPYHMGFSVV